MSRQNSPQSPAWSQEQPFDPCQCTWLRTTDHCSISCQPDKSFASWNLKLGSSMVVWNLKKSKDLFAAYNHESTGGFIFYKGLETSTNYPQKITTFGAGTMKRGLLGSFRFDLSDSAWFEKVATMSRQYSPQSPAWSQELWRLPVHRASLHASGCINGRDVTEKWTHGHDTSSAS